MNIKSKVKSAISRMTPQNTQNGPSVEVQRLVRPSRFAFRDCYGWPVERIIGRPITNVIRLILHTDIVQSCRRPNNRIASLPLNPLTGECTATEKKEVKT